MLVHKSSILSALARMFFFVQINVLVVNFAGRSILIQHLVKVCPLHTGGFTSQVSEM